jgi:hypothetical protein
VFDGIMAPLTSGPGSDTTAMGGFLLGVVEHDFNTALEAIVARAQPFLGPRLRFSAIIPNG